MIFKSKKLVLLYSCKTIIQQSFELKKLSNNKSVNRNVFYPEFWKDIEEVNDIDVAIIPSEPDELTDTENFEENNLEEVKDFAGTRELFVPIKIKQ